MNGADAWLDQCHFGDCRETLRRMPDGIVQTCVTSPPYFGLRDYGHAGQIGLESTPDAFVGKLVEVFREVRRVLRDDGTLWLNLGDSYASQGGAQVNGTKQTAGSQDGAWNGDSRKAPAGLKPKDLIGIPWRVAFALQADGWYLRQDIIWHKPNPMPESVTDRCTKAHEYIFMLSKSERYYFDAEAIKEPAVASHAPGNHSHKGATAYAEEEGEHHRTKAGLVAYAERQRAKGNRKTFRGGGVYTQGRSFDNSAEPCNDSVGNEPNVDGMRNKRSVWTVATAPYSGAHFATFPPALIEPCILAGAPVGGVVLDPFFGSGTTGQVAQALGRRWIGCELNPAYADLQSERTRQPSLLVEAA